MPITLDQFMPYRNNYDDYEETQRLLALFGALRLERHPFFLNAQEFDLILKWKLRGQYGSGGEPLGSGLSRCTSQHISGAGIEYLTCPIIFNILRP
jgi:hypothetical protein